MEKEIICGVEMPKPVAKIDISRIARTGELEGYRFYETPKNAPAGVYYVYTAEQLRETVAAAVAIKDAEWQKFYDELQPKPQPVQVPETAVYMRKDQLQKAAQSAMLCEVTPEPRQDRIRIYTTPPHEML